MAAVGRETQERGVTTRPTLRCQLQGPGAAGKSGDLLWRCRPHALGSSRGAQLGPEGRTPVVEATGARHGMSLISAITSRGQMRFMIKDRGGVNADVFIEFLKRLITC